MIEIIAKNRYNKYLITSTRPKVLRQVLQQTNIMNQTTLIRLSNFGKKNPRLGFPS